MFFSFLCIISLACIFNIMLNKSHESGILGLFKIRRKMLSAIPRVVSGFGSSYKLSIILKYIPYMPNLLKFSLLRNVESSCAFFAFMLISTWYFLFIPLVFLCFYVWYIFIILRLNSNKFVPFLLRFFFFSFVFKDLHLTYTCEWEFCWSKYSGLTVFSFFF